MSKLSDVKAKRSALSKLSGLSTIGFLVFIGMQLILFLIVPNLIGAATMKSNVTVKSPGSSTIKQLGDFRWQNRLVLIFGLEQRDLKKFQSDFGKKLPDIEDRNLLFFVIDHHLSDMEKRVSIEGTPADLRKRFGVDRSESVAILIGKDGGEKYRRDYLNLTEIFSVIDAMPMRQQEIMTKTENTTSIMVDFSRPAEQQWMIVNDGVMGGLSQSDIVLTTTGTALFQGNLSLENNGGFASTRTITTDNFTGDHKGVIIRIKGDGKRYQLRLRMDQRLDGISYRSHFQTQQNSWQTIKVPFSDFVPVFRGRVLEGVPPVKPERINQIGFLISDKQAGPFKLEIEWIQAYK